MPELSAQEAEQLLARGKNLTADTRLYLTHAVEAVRAGVARAHVVSHKVDGALLLELFTHGGSGSMITADKLERLRSGQHRRHRRHPAADRAAGGGRHAGLARPRAARARDAALLRDRARRRDRRLRRALPARAARRRNWPASRCGPSIAAPGLRREAAGARRGRGAPARLRRSCSCSPRAPRTGSSSAASPRPPSRRCPSRKSRSTTGSGAPRSW